MRPSVRIISIMVGLVGATAWGNAAVAQNLALGERGDQVAAVPIPHISLPSVSDLRVGIHPNRTRVVLDISRPVDFTYQLSSSGEAVFIDLPRINWQAQPFASRHNKGLVTEFKFAPAGGQGGRLSILAGVPISLVQPFLLSPSGGRGYRLVVDLVARETQSTQAAYSSPPGRVNGHLEPLHRAVYKPFDRFSGERKIVLPVRALPHSERLPMARKNPPEASQLRAQRPPSGTSNPYLKAIEERDKETAPPVEKGRESVDIPGLYAPGLYAKGGLGLAFAAESANSGTGNNNDMEFEIGYLISGAVGIDLQNNFRAEAEVNYQVSDLQSITGTARGTSVGTGNLKGDLTALTFMGNLAYDFKNQTRFTPFLMGGLGLARIALNEVVANNLKVADDADWVYAMQVGGGVSLDLGEKWSLEASYRFMETGDPSFSDEDGKVFKSEYSSHNFLIGTRYKF